MSERRRESRNSCYLRASILINGGEKQIDAEAHDISDRGARLVVLDGRLVPDQFVLAIPRRHLMERCEVKRRGAKELGVVFRQFTP